MEDILRYLANNWTSIALFLSIFLEITPIKINPIKSLIEYMSGHMNKDLSNQLHSIHEKINVNSAQIEKIQADADFKDAMEIKKDICDYATKLFREGLSMVEYKRVWELESRYDYYKKKYPDKINGELVSSFAYIHEQFKKGNILKTFEDNDH